MPVRAIKHQLACQFELTSDSSLTGRNHILVISRNHLVDKGKKRKMSDVPSVRMICPTL